MACKKKILPKEKDQALPAKFENVNKPIEENFEQDHLPFGPIFENISEASLAKSEEKYRIFFEANQDAITIFRINSDNTPSTFLDVNNAAIILGGYSKDDLAGMTPLAFEKDISDETIRRRLEEIESKGYAHFETLLIDKNKNEIPVEIQVIKILYENRPALMNIAKDIRERKRTEKALLESEERYRLIFDSSLDAILLTAPDGSILAANPSTCRMFQRTEEEIKQIGRSGLLDTSDPRLALAIEERNKTGKFAGELTYVRKDGTKFRGEVFTSVFKDKEGNSRTSMIIRDMTERRLTEDAVRLSEETLRKAQRAGKMIQNSLEIAEQRYRTVVEDQTELISRFSSDGRFIYANPAYCRFFNVSLDELISRKWQPIALEDDRERIEQQLSHLTPTHPVVTVENRVYKGDGSIRWIQFINRGIFDTANTLIEIQSVGRDISDLKEIQLSLQQKDHELSEKNEKLEKLNIAFEVVIDQKNEQLENLRSDIVKQYTSFVKPHLEELKDISQNWRGNQYLKLIEQGIQHILSPFAQHIMSLNHQLSPMEIQVASMIARGVSINDVAQELNISPHTVKYHRKNIRAKLGITNKKINLRSYLLRDIIQ